MIGFKSHSGDTQSSRPKKAHDNPVYRVCSLPLKRREASSGSFSFTIRSSMSDSAEMRSLCLLSRSEGRQSAIVCNIYKNGERAHETSRSSPSQEPKS